jgi:hypothetical protein
MPQQNINMTGIQKEYVLYAYPAKGCLVGYTSLCYAYQEFYMWVDDENRPYQKHYEKCLN